MDKINKFLLFTLVGIMTISLFTACQSKAAGEVKRTTNNPEAVFGKVKSAAGAKMLTPIVQRGDLNATGHILFEMNQAAESPTTVTFRIDDEVLNAYNVLNGTGYTMYPTDKLSFENEGVVTIKTGEKKSESIELNIQPTGIIGTTYAVAIQQ